MRATARTGRIGYHQISPMFQIWKSEKDIQLVRDMDGILSNSIGPLTRHIPGFHWRQPAYGIGLKRSACLTNPFALLTWKTP